ncbi:MAG TPA: serpin family protein, partial [Anaerolineaceae bacterium]|nr:serpin family protein [Anaerolineaceae bacterium]
MSSLTRKLKKTSPEDVAAVVHGSGQFALDLYRQLSSGEGSLFFSPFSISTALAMAYAGSAGSTQSKMAQALHFPLEQDRLHPAFAYLDAAAGQAAEVGGVQLRVANALWPQKGEKLLKEFTTILKKAYGVRIKPVDFAEPEEVRLKINAWVEEKTESKIKDLIAPGVLDSLTRLVLANAIYFYGEWLHKFDPNLTADAPFYGTGGESVVQMMSQRGTFRYGERDGLQAIELPYTGDGVSMLVLLPAAQDGLAALESSITSEHMETWISGLAETEVDLFLPKFELSSAFRLDDALRNLGMEDAFSHQADFSGMNGLQDLFISAALHKAFISVNEEGTEAAAASAVVMTLKSVPFPAVVFRADHPFLFLIRE